MNISDNNKSQPVITLNGLTKVFQTEEIDTYALQNIALTIMPGEFVAITGPSGCGKSTLLSILGLLDTANSGQYTLNGHDVSGLSMSELAVIRNSEIGFIFQAFNLIADLSIEANVELPLTYRNNLSKSERRDMVRQALELVGMSHRLKHYPSQLSGGQQQRVAVARALAGQPRILLADEPTGNLDSENGKVVMDLLNKLHDNGSTLCMVTHDISFAQQADRVIHMKDGEVVKAANLN
ncbi:ABC transporter ATP-binding protein [Idiomarina xiamenensis]|uniref:ABC transporter n=1 Tax=Idiomarina xiamenensis 10-D-4 TaxID=740709 RepID=K2K8N6_9GAMM|nr:ABC transporter ATP-binding protein [Idiomarina xiamenensis]EKE79324.1 ABC transporter [Idiomarina xiamenensis 10-D-4]